MRNKCSSWFLIEKGMKRKTGREILIGNQFFGKRRCNVERINWLKREKNLDEEDENGVTSGGELYN